MSNQCGAISRLRPGYGPCIRPKGHQLDPVVGHKDAGGRMWNEGPIAIPPGLMCKDCGQPINEKTQDEFVGDPGDFAHRSWACLPRLRKQMAAMRVGLEQIRNVTRGDKHKNILAKMVHDYAINALAESPAPRPMLDSDDRVTTRMCEWTFVLFPMVTGETRVRPDRSSLRRHVREILQRFHNSDAEFGESQSIGMQWRFESAISEKRRLEIHAALAEVFGEDTASEFIWSGTEGKVETRGVVAHGKEIQ